MGFGWRSWIQYRRTGSTGFRGPRRPPRFTGWVAGAGFLAAIIVGLVAPVLQLFGVVCPIELLHTQLIQASGIFLAVVGVVATFFAQREMGASWRIGVDPSETTTLVRDGVFAIVRNPIFSAMLIFAAGITLMAPNPLAVAGFLLLFTAIELQVRRVEEPYLLDTHGDAYRTYTNSVGRFLPGIGRTVR
ncbi:MULTISPECIES: methyltransferase family protein [Mycobacterium]|uniref:methyltransferase family protein n=1 Tax=Mycobacterium TaxID=1763 RepID=UPI0002DBDC87|nr:MULTISPECIES: isoprenylcysteine carboxylmethyltransferase family protein [Mycobacterium]GJP28516.1 hypothetical protein NJB18091_12640 [Mycobacterium marinum]GLB87371.1 hypothetical protein SRL2020130_01880 [Mycobacterium kiyosense]GLB99579.1 hypothetical protein SRL2020400_01710 [Mycobacterium kiyosense]GLC06498.1 hypothetical protein SRL2020411_11440 [Mycobacterium kiyosense]GLC11585.1 hypothetical protein SRL2020448_01880 [Mycobacterium kiyosense]